MIVEPSTTIKKSIDLWQFRYKFVLFQAGEYLSNSEEISVKLVCYSRSGYSNDIGHHQ